MAKRKPKTPPPPAAIPEQVVRSILFVRGDKVLLDSQLAVFYGVPTKALVQAVKRNLDRFPADFMFQLTNDEWDILKSQTVTSSLRSQTVTLNKGRGQHRKYLPYAFTEQGVAMLSGVLRSPQAVEVNIQIMRAFVRLRQLLNAHKELAERLAKLEQALRTRDHAVDQQFRQIFVILDQLFSPATGAKRPIGFRANDDAQGGQSR